MRISVRWGAWRLASLVAFTALLIGGCGLLEESAPVATPTPSTANVLIDPGFETTNPPAWRWANPFVAGPFEASTALARSGERSAALTTGETGSPAMDAATQTLNVADVPEFFSGYYRVDDWPDDSSAYLQLTVRVASDGPEPVRALRFIIAGAPAEPEVPPPDLRYVFLNRDAPESGGWTYFGYPLRDAFVAEAFAIPSGFASLDVTIEVHSTTGQGGVMAHYDDLYFGPQSANPNRPKETRE